MTIIGSAYVDIRAITDKLQADIEEALAKLPDNIEIKVETNTEKASEHIDEFIHDEDLEEIIIDVDVSTSTALVRLDDFVAEASTHEVIVDIDVDTTSASEHLDDFMAAEDDATINVDVDVETLGARLNLGEFLMEWGSKVVNFIVKLDGAIGAEAELDILSRPRVAEIITKVKGDGFSRLQKTGENLATFLSGISGMTALRGIIDEAITAKVHLAELTPQVAMTAEKIGGLATAGFAAGGALLSLGQSLVQIMGVLPVLPGVFVGLEIAMKITTTAFQGMKKAAPELAAEMKALKESIAVDFWSKASEGFHNLITDSGVLSGALSDTSKMVGNFWGTIFDGMSKGSFAKGMAGDFKNLDEGIKIMTGSSSVFLHIIETIGEFGSAYIPKLAEGFVDMSKKFDAFLTKANADGTLARWASSGMDALRNLGSVVGNLWNVLGGLAQAATTAGGMTLGVLGDGLKRLADTIHAADFQKNLVNIFKGANDGMKFFTDGLGNLIGSFGHLSPAIKTVETQIGKTFGTLFTMIGKVIDRPEVAKGVTDLFAGIGKGVDELGKAVDPVGDKLGTIMSFVGDLAHMLGSVLGEAAAKLIPPVQHMLDTIQPLIPIISDVTKNLMDWLAPGLKTLADDIIPPAVEWLKKILPPINDLIKAITPDIVAVFEAFGKSMTFGNAGKGAQTDADGIEALAKSIKDGQKDIKDFKDIMSKLDEGTAWLTSTKHTQEFHNSTVSMFNDMGKNNQKLSEDIHKTFSSMWGDATKSVDKMNHDVNKGLDDFWSDAKRNNEGASKDLKKGWDDFWGGLKKGTDSLDKDVNKNIDKFWTDAKQNNEKNSKDLKKSWDDFWGGLDKAMKPFNDTAGKIQDHLHKLWGSLVSRPIDNLAKAWDKGWKDMQSSNQKLSGDITKNIGKWWGDITKGFSTSAQVLGKNWDNTWNGLKSSNQKLSGDINKNIGKWWGDITKGFSTSGRVIGTNWTNSWNGIKSTNQKISNDVNKAIGTWWSGVTKDFTKGATDIGNKWDSGWKDIQSTNEKTSADVNKSLDQWWSDIKAGWTTASTQISTAWDTMWKGINTVGRVVGEQIQKAVDDFWTGVKKSWDDAMKVVKDIEERGWDAIFEYLGGLWQRMLDAGAHIIDGLVHGIQDGVGAVGKAIGDIGQNILDGISHIMDMHSPSRKMFEKGQFVVLGLADGITAHGDIAVDAMTKTANRVLDAATIKVPPMTTSSVFGAQAQNPNVFAAAIHGNNMPVPGSYGYQQNNQQGTTTVVTPTVIVNPSQGMDEKQIGQMAATELYWNYLNR